MRLVHLADTHLGFAAYRALDPELGINQREADNYRAFSCAVDSILELAPDVVLHAGDLFDAPRPSNRALAFALQQLLRLTAAGIPVVIISGNHSTPKLQETGSVFKIFELFPGIHPVYEEPYKTLTFAPREESGGPPEGCPPAGRHAATGGKRLVVHAVPHSADSGDLHLGLSLLEPQAGNYNVLTLHCAAAGIAEFSMAELSERAVDISGLPNGFDYVALGHYHRYTEVAPGCFYSGSLERITFAEVRQPKGFIELDLATGEHAFHPVETRDMADIETIPARGLSAEELGAKVEAAALAAVPAGKVVRLTIEDADPVVYNSLDFRRLRQLTSEAVHFELRCGGSGDDAPVIDTQAAIGALETEFMSYLDALDLKDAERADLSRLGLDYLKQAAAQEEQVRSKTA